MENQYNIHCPNCNHEFNVEEALSIQIKEGLSQDIISKENKLREDYKAKQAELQIKENALKEAEGKLELVIAAQLKEKEAKLKAKVEKDIRETVDLELKEMQASALAKDEQLKDFRKKELSLLRQERELRSKAEELDLEVERKLAKEREVLKKSLEANLNEKSLMQMKEKDLLIKQLTDRVDDMKRKADQGSMQVQGEAQELVIEEVLKGLYPIDTIEEVGKGQRGADCIQQVRNHTGRVCGSIVYESKRTKSFGADWPKKLKEDTLRVKGNIAVIVSSVLPEGISGMGLHEGVWVCDFKNLGNLSLVLRHAIIKEFEAIDHQANKGDKMEMLFAYLTSDEFNMQMQSIVDGFTGMKENLDKQKRSMNVYWSKQEKQLEMVVLNTTTLYGSVKGIAGAAIETINQLELDEGESQAEIRKW